MRIKRELEIHSNGDKSLYKVYFIDTGSRDGGKAGVDNAFDL